MRDPKLVLRNHIVVGAPDTDCDKCDGVGKHKVGILSRIFGAKVEIECKCVHGVCKSEQ
jgi:hypothetical protein